MTILHQHPAPGSSLRACAGDVLLLELKLSEPQAGRAWLRTNLGRAALRRRELIESVRDRRSPLARDWHDLPMVRVSERRFAIRVPLLEPGVFAAKACFTAADEQSPIWPEGKNLTIKVASAATCAGNSVYTAFPRQFGPNLALEGSPPAPAGLDALDAAGYAVIPPSGTFRDLRARLGTILDEQRFRILQLLPVHPVPATFARMGRFGSPFAGLDFRAVDPALAEFDPRATPMDQFRELLDGVHARGAQLFLDLPANHTGWASALQLHRPEWFRRDSDGRYHSPGAWGVVWEDLVELDYRHQGLRDFMAEVFAFWCREGVDGFRCDAGYMIPPEAWAAIVARVRQSYPDTIFLLEGLGGKISVTRRLLEEANLDWAYSEVFQTTDRADFERYFPGAQRLSAEAGPLVHFAETHDNLRLAARSPEHARMRVRLCALLAEQGAFGITNGVEWFARERVTVHGAGALRWGASPNLLGELRCLNTLLGTHPAFGPGVAIRLVQEREGNALAILRSPPDASRSLLALVNLDASLAQPVCWPADAFDPADDTPDLLGDRPPAAVRQGAFRRLILAPGQVLCLARDPADAPRLERALAVPPPRTLAAVHHQRLRATALRLREVLLPDTPLAPDEDPDAIAAEFERDPLAFLERRAGQDGYPRVSCWSWPGDAHRVAPVPPGHFLLIDSFHAFQARLADPAGATVIRHESIALPSGHHVAVFSPLPEAASAARFHLHLCLFAPEGARRHVAELLALPLGGRARVRCEFSGTEVRSSDLLALLTNGRGAMAHVPARWPELRSRYDALLAANPDPRVPCDRQVLFSRCRVWVRHRGYSQSVDAACLERFVSVPGGGEAGWRFRVPVGLGRWIPLELRLQLARGANRVLLAIRRGRAPRNDAEALPDAEPVQAILRPDIESRSFHDTTKAFLGPENAWRAATAAEPRGVLFRPPDRPGLALRCDRGAYIHEPEWQYMVARPLEAERGLDAASDLFSPGYFIEALRGGETLELTAALDPDTAPPPPTQPVAPARRRTAPPTLQNAALLALRDFLAARDERQTVIAGYPWFLDWGRDTLIVARGMIAGGLLQETLDLLREFGRFEREGTLPNMIRGQDHTNRDTSDAPLWLALAARDLARVLGLRTVLEADCGGRPLGGVLRAIAAGYRRGTGNGIRVDPASGLVFSPAHFTWMDTNHPAATPREGYPVEIQALWIATLAFLEEAFPGEDWAEGEQRARRSLRSLFWREADGFLADCLHAAPGTSAADARPDDHLRCNQLLALTLDGFREPSASRSILRACETLLVPGAIRSLADRPVTAPLPVRRDGTLLNDPLRPYGGRYAGDEDTRRKPAYHNGTAWIWPFPSYAEAMVRVYGPAARPAALALLGSCRGLFEDGAAGHLPEILDGDAPHAQRGCTAQAWSVSELLRVLVLLRRGPPSANRGAS